MFYKCFSPFHMKRGSTFEGHGHGLKHLVLPQYKSVVKGNSVKERSIAFVLDLNVLHSCKMSQISHCLTVQKKLTDLEGHVVVSKSAFIEVDLQLL